jgi:hypothetical protein
MAWYTDEALEAFAIVVWSLAFVLFLMALALPCPLCRHDVKTEPPVVINVLPASWDWYLCHTFSPLMRGRFTGVTLKITEGCKSDGFDCSWVLNIWFCG